MKKIKTLENAEQKNVIDELTNLVKPNEKLLSKICMTTFEGYDSS